jgi:hypothetical protein
MQFAKRAGEGYKRAHSRLFDAGGNANNSHTHDMQTAETEVPRAHREIKLSPADEARFWKKVDKYGPTMPHMETQCWVWTASLSFGYGQFKAGGQILKVHRVAWILSNGQIAHDGSFHGICVCHRCDNPSCCNPAHLFLGTQRDNADDRTRKGRTVKGNEHYSKLRPERVPRGNTHYSRLRPRLADAQVLEIRAIYAAGSITQRNLAAQFGVSKPTIGRIINRKIWKHV